MAQRDGKQTQQIERVCRAAEVTVQWQQRKSLPWHESACKKNTHAGKTGSVKCKKKITNRNNVACHLFMCITTTMRRYEYAT